ncbi:MAG TPA: S53 family peptidase [Acidimicrobiales bacterium]|nr:S53 family peptidase [Acidimicrobiales bacterium]
MARRKLRVAALAGACALGGSGVLAAGGVATAATTGSTPGLVQLTGEVVHGLGADTDLGAVDASAPMTVGVGLQVDAAARQAAFRALTTPGSPTYHHWYTPASFLQAFGVSAPVAAQARAYATRAGLRVTYASPDGSYLLLSGTASQVESTFSVAEHEYRAADGSTFTANTGPATVPSSVVGLSGLTSLGVARTDLTRPAGATPAQDLCLESATSLPAGVPNGAYCTGALTPTDVRSVYAVPPGDLGNGQKVAVFGEGELANVISDLRTFEKTYSQPTVPVREVLVGDNLQDSSGDPEWDLDSQASTGMAPDLQELDFYFGSSLSDQSITATYEAWANDPAGPLTGNSSFGGAEDLEYLGAFLEDTALQQAAMEGRTMFASAGDVGGSCLPGANGITNTVVPCVEYPASSPYVTAVGGTVVYTAADASGNQVQPPTRALEYAWNYSGGGHSTFEPAQPWQPPAFPAGQATPCVGPPGTGQTCRGVPDVSALSGDIITNGYAYVYQGAVSEEGGTSLSSPLWAGSWANVEAASTATGGAGFAPAALYGLAADPTKDAASFFDVGGTTDSIPGYGNGQYPTLPRTPGVDPTGYDFVTGLGSPVLSAITSNLDGTTTPATTTTYPADPATPTVVDYGFTSPYNSPAFTGCSTSGTVSDPTGDATVPDPAGDAFDLTSMKLSSDATQVTFAGTVVDASTDAANDVDYAWQFTYQGATYAVTVDTGPSPSAALYLQNYVATPIGLLVEQAPTSLATLAAPTVDEAPNGTISVSMPLSVFNSAAKPTVPLAAGALLSQVSLFTNTGPAATALANDFNVDPVDQANFFQCTYAVDGPAAGPAPALPEAPLAVGVPLAALAAGALVLRRRSRRAA